MTKFIPDIKSRRWVLLAPGRLGKPIHKNNVTPEQRNGLNYLSSCPFCLGNEAETPPEIERVHNHNHWLIRVFANKFPITDIHEVVVHSPDHLLDIEQMNNEQLTNLFTIYQNRINVLKKEGVPFVFRNYGERAGTSIAHPHSQIIVLPSQINLDILALEPINNIIINSQHCLAYCPDFSQYPYEVWFTHQKCQHLEINDPVLQEVKFHHFDTATALDLAQCLQKVIITLRKILGDFSYNYYISPKPPFYLRIIPRILTRGGFEIGTGLSTNVLDPKEASQTIKNNL
jgi:UDPglucose--hexose-1-phosphate uridylyltransferase